MSSKEKRSFRQNKSAIIVDKVRGIIDSPGLDAAAIKKYMRRLADIDTDKLEETLASLSGILTPLDMKYIVCFYIDMDVADISSVFSIEPASVYTVRYRIKKKFRNNGSHQFLI